ncbi:hypothetical protein BCR44DRAFT_1007635 [Catenaria anguillulae PL171]|uniref:Integrase core domain-containing protein n=1 Tax=Catenaria anguillulae PL171 TaxID=765915 RepID=A0A1Y2I3N2_9FUNG|nr:hypothetical protein BCR44DRAFT_1007635 [Catenaria anguillulae PL171]
MAWASVLRGLEREGYLNVDNRIHIAALHWVVLPALNRSLAHKVQAWNHHPLSSQSNRTPLDLFISDRVSAADEDHNFVDAALFGIEDADTAVEDSPNHVEVCLNVSAEEEALLNRVLMEHIGRDYLNDSSDPFAVNSIIRAVTVATAFIPY